MPSGPARRVSSRIHDATNFFERTDVLGVTSQCVLHLGLIEYGVDAAQPVRLRIGHGIEEAQGVAEIGQSLGVGPTALGFLCRKYCVIYGLFRLLAAAEMKGEQFGDLVAAVAVEVFEGVADSAVICPTMALEEAPIGRLLRQRVAKDVNSPVGDNPLIEEFEAGEFP